MKGAVARRRRVPPATALHRLDRDARWAPASSRSPIDPLRRRRAARSRRFRTFLSLIGRKGRDCVRYLTAKRKDAFDARDREKARCSALAAYLLDRLRAMR